MTHHVALRQELNNYRGQNVEADVCGFSLPGFSLRKSEPTLAEGTGEAVAPPDLPHLALLARLYHGVEATRCQAERNFSALSILIGTLRASMSPFKVEQMMILKLNQGCRSKVQRRHCCAARKTQPMPPGCAIGTRGGCWRDGGCRNIEEFVRSGECMPQVEGMGDVGVRDERC